MSLLSAKLPPTHLQTSAGGVVFRSRGKQIEIALISVDHPLRWLLPKGRVENGESPDKTALREVQEETGIKASLVCPLDKIEYWYNTTDEGEQVRYRKFVYFYLFQYRSGNIKNHEQEVLEAQWVKISEASKKLTFENEKKMVKLAEEKIESLF